MTDTIRSWPLYAVADLRDREGIRLGELIQAETWTLTRPSREEISALPLPADVRSGIDFWFNELQREVDAANGADNGAAPMTGGRVEARRAFHNNNLRIGPGTSQVAPAAA